MMHCELVLDFVVSVIEDGLSLRYYKPETARETCFLNQSEQVISDNDKQCCYYIDKFGCYATNFCVDVD